MKRIRTDKNEETDVVREEVGGREVPFQEHLKPAEKYDQRAPDYTEPGSIRLAP